MEYKGGYISLDSMKQLLDGVETSDNLELLREIENSPGDGSEEALTPYGAKCVADEVEELRNRLAQAERQRDEARGLLRHSNEQVEKEQKQGAMWYARCREARGLLRDISEHPNDPGRRFKIKEYLRDTGE